MGIDLPKNLISPFGAKLIEILPKNLVAALGRRIMNGYVDKFAEIELHGMENLEGVKRPIIFISNHLSNSDGLILNRVLKDEDVTYVAGVKLSQNPVTNLAIQMAKTTLVKPNSADKEGIEKIIKIIKNGGSILIFPEGTRSRSSKMIKAKKGIYLIIKLTGAKVIPIGLSGTEKLLPISDEDMGTEKFQNAKVNVNIGKAINIPKKDKEEDRHLYEERVVDHLMSSIAELIPSEYRGVYGENE